MKKGFALLIVFSLVCVSVLLSTGCVRAAQRTIESAIERELQQEGITVQEDGEEVTVTQQTDSGDVQMSWGTSDLPDGIPGEVPIYANMNIEFSYKEGSSSDDRSTNSFQVVGQSGDPIDAILSWHESQFNNWSEYSTSSWSSDGSVGHYISARMGSLEEGRRLSVELQVIQGDGEEMVTVAYYIEDVLAK